MYKAFILIKRKPGMSREAFIDYYENKHVPLGVPLVPNLKGDVRHYLTPYGNDVYAGDAEGDAPYDVVTELWFDDRADFEQGMAYLTEPETAAILAADEENLFDRSSIAFFTVETHESDLPAPTR